MASAYKRYLLCIKDIIDRKKVFVIYSVPEIEGGANLAEAEWDNTESLSIVELAKKIRDLAETFSEDDYRKMIKSLDEMREWRKIC